MAGGGVSLEIVDLLNEKYLFRFKKAFSEIEDDLLGFIYVRLLCAYDEVNKLNCDMREQKIEPNTENLMHIIRCLRPLGLSYLATKPKDLLDHKIAIRIFFALHDRVTSKFGKNISQRVRMVVKKEQMPSKTNQIRKTKVLSDLQIPFLAENSENSIPVDAGAPPEEKRGQTDDTFAYPNDPVERRIPGGWQIPRTPMKEDAFIEPRTIVPLPPPPIFNNSPKIVSKEKDLENTSPFILTPPSEFSDKTVLDSCSLNSETPPETQVLPESPSPSKDISRISCGKIKFIDSSPETPDIPFNKRETYIIPKSQSPSDNTSDNSPCRMTITENSCADNPLDKRRTYIFPKSHSPSNNTDENSPHEVTISDNSSPDTPDILLNKRRTYVLPKSRSPTDNIEDDSPHDVTIEDNSSPDTSDIPLNKRRTYVLPKSRCPSDDTSDNSLCEVTITDNYSSDAPEIPFNKRRTYVLPKSRSPSDNTDVTNEDNSSPDTSDIPLNKRRTYVLPKFHNPPDDVSAENSPGKCLSKRLTKAPSIKDATMRDKRRTYCIPMVPDIMEENDKVEEFNDETEHYEPVDVNGRRSYFLGANHSSDNMNNDRNINGIELDTSFKVKPLFVNLLKDEISFVECHKGAIPNGKELPRTPPTCNGSVVRRNSTYLEHSFSAEYLVGVDPPVCVVNTGLKSERDTVNQSNVLDSLNAMSSRLENQSSAADSAFEITSRNSFCFDDSLAIFPSKKNGKVEDLQCLENSKKQENIEDKETKNFEEEKCMENLGDKFSLDERDAEIPSDVNEKSSANEESGVNVKIKKSTRHRNPKILDKDIQSGEIPDGREKCVKKKTFTTNKLDAVEKLETSEINVPKNECAVVDETKIQVTVKDNNVLKMKLDDDQKSEPSEKRKRTALKSLQKKEDFPDTKKVKQEDSTLNPTEIEPKMVELNVVCEEVEDKVSKARTKRTTKLKLGSQEKKSDIEIKKQETESRKRDLIPTATQELNNGKEDNENLLKKNTRLTVKPILSKEDNVVKDKSELVKEEDLELKDGAEQKIKNTKKAKPKQNKMNVETKVSDMEEDADAERNVVKKRARRTAVKSDVQTRAEEENSESEILEKNVKKIAKAEPKKKITKDILKHLKGSKKESQGPDAKLNDGIIEPQLKINGKKIEIEEKGEDELYEDKKIGDKPDDEIPEKSTLPPTGQTEFKNLEPRRTQRGMSSSRLKKQNSSEALTNLNESESSIDASEIKSRSGSVKSKTRAKQTLSSEEEVLNKNLSETKTRSGSLKSKTMIEPSLEEEHIIKNPLKSKRSNSLVKKKKENPKEEAEPENVELEEKEMNKKTRRTNRTSKNLSLDDTLQENNKKKEIGGEMVDSKSKDLKEENSKPDKKNVNSRQKKSKVKSLIEKFNNVEKEMNSKDSSEKENLYKGDERKTRMGRKPQVKCITEDAPSASIPLAENNARPKRRCKVIAQNAITEMMNEI